MPERRKDKDILLVFHHWHALYAPVVHYLKVKLITVI